MVYKVWRGAGVVERGGLENRCALAYPGFESLSLRHPNFGMLSEAIHSPGKNGFSLPLNLWKLLRPSV